MQHNFMPGDSVKLGNETGKVIERGAERGRYYVVVQLPTGKRKLVNEQISTLKKV